MIGPLTTTSVKTWLDGIVLGDALTATAGAHPVLPPTIWCCHDLLEIDSYHQQRRALGGALSLKVRCRGCGQRDRVSPRELPAVKTRISVESLRVWRWVIARMKQEQEADYAELVVEERAS